MKHSLSGVLSGKKELIKLFSMAAVLAFAVGALSSIFVAQTSLPTISVIVLAGCIVLIVFALLARELWDSLSFKDDLKAVVFIDPKENAVIDVKSYDFANDLTRILSAVKAENRSIFSEWENGPLVATRAPGKKERKEQEPEAKSSKQKQRYVAIKKLTGEAANITAPSSAKLLNESISFLMLESLSTHLSTYFNDWDEDKYITEYTRDHIPGVLLKNRVLNLLSTPIEQRDVFLDAFPDGSDAKEGEVISLWGSDGSMYSRFDLILPKGSKIEHDEIGHIKISTPRLTLEILNRYSGTSKPVSRSFIENYIGRGYREIECRQVEITMKCKIKPMSLLSTAGWRYYHWLDSYRSRARHEMHFDQFQEDIHWSSIEHTLFALRGRFRALHRHIDAALENEEVGSNIENNGKDKELDPKAVNDAGVENEVVVTKDEKA